MTITISDFEKKLMENPSASSLLQIKDELFPLIDKTSLEYWVFWEQLDNTRLEYSKITGQEEYIYIYSEVKEPYSNNHYQSLFNTFKYILDNIYSINPKILLNILYRKDWIHYLFKNNYKKELMYILDILDKYKVDLDVPYIQFYMNLYIGIELLNFNLDLNLEPHILFSLFYEQDINMDKTNLYYNYYCYINKIQNTEDKTLLKWILSMSNYKYFNVKDKCFEIIQQNNHLVFMKNGLNFIDLYNSDYEPNISKDMVLCMYEFENMTQNQNIYNINYD